ncbi:hypothetical protein [Streptomyces chrestomyceticus]|uniref:hypothetical protein n=1 Tax=Streptomyces chrestomyceticus TaxID=68185 RepID=UPI0019D19F7D|nr:hypothetical protein [Streptomyces chrestomyceticus]
MATHRTAATLVSAATVGALALGAVGSAAAASEDPKPPVRNHSIIVDDISRLADASAELAEKSADSRGHSVQVRSARTRLDTVLQDAQRLADQLNEDSDRTVTADSVRLRRVSQDLRTQLDELAERRAPAPGEDTDSTSLTGSVSRSVTDIFTILGLDKLLGGLQQPADRPAAAPAANRPARPAAEQADDAEDQPAAQPKAPISDPRPGDGTQQAADPQPAGDQQPAADAQPPADAPRQQPAEAQQQGVPSLVNSVLSLPTVLLKALGL